MTKALSLWQPWASLVAYGIKTIETRSWATSYRGPLLIHATQTTKHAASESALWAALDGRPAPKRAIVARVDLVDVVPIEGMNLQGFEHFVCPDIGGGLTLYRFEHGGDRPPTVNDDVTDQLPFGDFTEGRFAWLFENIELVDPPIPARGRQRLFDVAV